MYTILKLAGDEFEENERQVKMLSNRDDKHNEHEESEYHFSDDDVSYEVETESSKPAAPRGAGLMSRLTGSKRMVISLGVFLLLVFVVYKMVAPTTTTAPSTDFAPEAAAPAPTPQIATATPPPAAPPSPEPQAVTNNTVTQTPPAPIAEQKPAQPNSEVVVGMPAVIPVQSTVPAAPAPVATTTPTNASPPPPPAPVEAMSASAPSASAPPPPVVMVTNAPVPVPTAQPVSPGMDSAMASMVSTNEKLIGQMQADFNQRLNDYAGQTKAMQGQLESLNARVVNMEAQLNTIVQSLSRPTPAPGPTAPPPAVQQQQAVPVSSAPEIKVSYNVQAIIPGRAWLRSESGETVTVAEGDTIKDLGRVTKIDPYDGIVEVNTGNKVVSISYGTSE